MDQQLLNYLQTPSCTLVDVREIYEFQMGHADGAINIPLSILQAKLKQFENMAKPIVLYCRSGGRSGQATNFLQSIGITEVYNGGSLANIEQHKNHLNQAA